jgi:hypothetical protein
MNFGDFFITVYKAPNPPILLHIVVCYPLHAKAQLSQTGVTYLCMRGLWCSGSCQCNSNLLGLISDVCYGKVLVCMSECNNNRVFFVQWGVQWSFAIMRLMENGELNFHQFFVGHKMNFTYFIIFAQHKINQPIINCLHMTKHFGRSFSIVLHFE